MNRRTLLSSGVAALAVAAVGGFWTTAAKAQTPDEVDTSSVQEMVLGSEDAPITLVEYASFTCPHCKSFHDNVFDKLKANYIDTGKVRFVYRDVYFDRYGLWAAMIARCDGGTRFFGITDMLYEQQEDWLRGAKSEADIADNLRQIGKVAGMNEATIDACMADADNARTLVAWYQDNASADEVTGTPTLIIDGESHSNMSYEDLSAILDEKLS